MSVATAAPDLTPQQREAVERRGVVFVAAGAGTGKTRVLVERVARATAEGLAPERVLVVTYTERAARELRERLRGRLGADGERVEVSTIHGFCARLLREHAFRAGVDPSFRVLGEADARILRSEAFERALADALETAADETADLLGDYGAETLRTMVARVYDSLRAAGSPLSASPPPAPDLGAAVEAMVACCDAALAALDGDQDDAGGTAAARVAELRALCLADDDALYLTDLRELRLAERLPRLDGYDDAVAALERAARDAVSCAHHRRLVVLLERFDGAYAALKEREGALDFEDLQLRARELLRSDAQVRERVADRVRHLLVDEFQDTNRLQCEVLDLIVGEDAERFYVGDENQSIYRFRHAEVAIFSARMAEVPDPIVLRHNYRARPELLELVNAVFGEAFGEGYSDLQPGSFEGDGFALPPELLVVEGPGSSRAEERRREEARLLGERLAQLVEAGEHGASDVVVLLRSGADVAIYEEGLRAAGLAAHSLIGRSYFEHQAVRDVVAYLRLLRNRYDDYALLTVLASPLVGVSNDGLMCLREAARAALFHALANELPEALPPSDRQLLRAFRQRYDRLVAASAELGLHELCTRIVADHDFDLACLAQADGRRRFANLRKLLRLAREYEALRGPDLAGFVAFVASQSGGAREADAPTAEEGVDAVRLMTIHAAKGLEFPVVVVADCSRGVPRAGEGVVVLPDGRFGFRIPGPSGQALSPPAYEDVLAAERTADADEGMRLGYVAMTRAMQRLILSGGVREGAGPPSGSMLAWLLQALGLDLAGMPRDEPVDVALANGATLRVTRAAGALEAEAQATPESDAAAAPTVAGQPPAAAEPAQLSLLETDPSEHAHAVSALPPLEPIPRAPAHVPHQLSYSSLSLHERCPYRYFAERVLGLPQREMAAAAGREGRLSALEIGDAVHALLETDGAAVLEGRYATALGDEDRALIAGFVESWRASPLAARVAALAVPRRELAFAFAHDGVVLRGRFDACGVEEDGTTLVVDYKTNVVGELDPAAIVADDYELQRCVYALAALRSGAAQVEVAFAFLEPPGAIVARRYGPLDEPELAATLSAAVARLRTSAFEARPSDRTCPGCGALDRICAGRRVQPR